MERIQQYDMRTFLLYIDSYTNAVPVGRFIAPCLNESGTFQSMTQLMLKIDRYLDITGAPQAFHTVRSFSSFTFPLPEAPDMADTRPGTVASFSLRVLFRRNASWQGTVTWMDKNQSRHFRSALELISLIHSAISMEHFSAYIPLSDTDRFQAEEA